MDNAYAPLDGRKLPSAQQDNTGERRINTTVRNAWYGSVLVSIILASVAFWSASRSTPLLFSLSATQSVENHAKSMTFVWTLIGTILAFATGTLFNQLLKISIQQSVAEQGLKIGLLEFWSRLYSRKWLHDHKSGRLLLSVFSVIFAIACGLLVSAYTGLITPTQVYIEDQFRASEMDLSSAPFWNWFQEHGRVILNNCSSIRTYGKGHDALTLAMCPQTQDPLPYIAAGLASIETKYAEYDPTTNVLGITFTGTTRGVLPQGWNTISYFNTVPSYEQPPVMYYNYSVIQQGISANVSCQSLGKKSNITWLSQGDAILQTNNGLEHVDVFLQNVTFGPNKAKNIDFTDSNLLLSGGSFIPTFESYAPDDTYLLEFASYGKYERWFFPNMTCSIAPYITNVNVTYHNATGQFSAEVVSIPGSLLRIPISLASVTDWLFRISSIMTGNQAVNAMIALQNTPSYESGILRNVTINWPATMEKMLEGMVEYHATRLRMIMTAEMNSSHIHPSGYAPVKGFTASWRLGYNGEAAPIATLFPLQGFVLLCAIIVITIGARTGVKHVSDFDPTNTTHLIVASAMGGRSGGLGALRGENARFADSKALNLKVEYKDSYGFREVNNLGQMEYTELQGVRATDTTTESPKSALFSRRPFMRTTTG